MAGRDLTAGVQCRGSAPLDLTKGLNAISQDLDQIVYRMKMLGFNAVRLPMTFDRVWGLGQVWLMARHLSIPEKSLANVSAVHSCHAHHGRVMHMSLIGCNSCLVPVLHTGASKEVLLNRQLRLPCHAFVLTMLKDNHACVTQHDIFTAVKCSPNHIFDCSLSCSSGDMSILAGATLKLYLQAPLNLTRKCVVPSVNDIERTLIPPRLPQLPLAQNTKELPQAPPDVEGGICNADMPDDTTVNRYLWVIQRFVEQVRPLLLLAG